MASIISAGTTSGTALNFTGDTSGNLVFQTGAGANTITVPNETGTIITSKTPGTVLQVVNATCGAWTSSTSTTLADTGLTASITPKFATSKILIFVDVNGCYKQNDTSLNLVLLRGSTQILKIDEIVAYTGANTLNAIGSSSCNYLDSPATTSATTYKVQYATLVSGRAVAVQNYYTVNGYTNSTITLMEIAQ